MSALTPYGQRGHGCAPAAPRSVGRLERRAAVPARTAEAMSAEVISIGALLVMFVVGTVLPINLGILGFVATFVVGTASLGLTEDEIFEGFPAKLFVTIVGVTYLFSVARRNGTIDWLVAAGVRLVRGKVELIPWVLFLVAAMLTAFGTFTPAAVAILAPIGMNFAYRYKLNPLVVGMMVISGGHAGAFSPLAVSGALVLGLVDKTDLEVSAVALFRPMTRSRSLWAASAITVSPAALAGCTA
ncbi:SLC13 family permease [Streptomyces europaeiscabiei]|uniref:SLC13 family permease n=1 Tax=Streptomyces europaeiscabiei TaxID=146819 RepID=UPI0038F7B030